MAKFKEFYNMLIKFLVIIINSYIILKVFLSGYSIVFEERLIIKKVLMISIPILGLLFSLYFSITKKKVIFFATTFLFLFLTAINLKFSIVELPNQIKLMNTFLGQGKEIFLSDISLLTEWIIVFFSLVGFLSLYIYPFNIIIFDMVFIGFLWGVDYIKGLKINFNYILVLFTYLLLRHRYDTKEDFKQKIRKSKTYDSELWKKYFQFISVSLVIILTSFFVFSEIRGAYYDPFYRFISKKLSSPQSVANIRDTFDLSYVGYSDTETELGGDVDFREDPVVRMTVSSEKIPKYIKGSTRKYFTGHSWQKSSSNFVETNVVGDSRINRINMVNEKEEIATINHINLRISSPLTPYHTRSVSFENNMVIRPFYSNIDQQFAASSIITGSYEIIYSEMETIDFYQGKNVIEYKSNLENYKDELQIPDFIETEIRDLAINIAGDIDDTAQKAIAIRDYLKMNYVYSLNPGDKNIKDKFLYNFLFESKQGYCVHYATALTIMLRSVGIPARYVEGFSVSSEKAVNGEILIRDSEAHAWTEILVDDVNNHWIPIDATGNGQDYLDEIRRTQQEETTTQASTTTTKLTTSTKEVEQKNTNSDTESNKLPFIVIFFLMLILIFLPLIHLFRKRKMEEIMNNTDSSEFIKKVFSLYEDGGLFLKDSQTNLEKSSKIESPSARKQMEDLVKINYAEKYGEKSIKNNIGLKKDVLNEAYNFVRLSKGKFYHFFKKNFL